GELLNLDPVVALDPAPNADFSGLSASLLRGLVGSDTRIEFSGKALAESNNWTISGKLTESGKPLLANDPHRVIAAPSLRYIIHLVAPGWDVIGAGEPGLPGVALGHNQNIAWGFTIFGLDQQDLYIEELNPSNPLQYRTASGREMMKVQKETFAVRGEANVVKELKFTSHGPVLWEDGKRALAMRWVGAEPGTAGYLGSLAVYRVKRIKEVLEQAKASGKKLTIVDVQKLQTDVLSIPARELIGLLRHAAGNSADPAVQLLLSWDDNVTRESAAAALFEVWMQDVSAAVLRKVAPEGVWEILDELATNQLVGYLSHPSASAFGA